jgi:hypothetical protein
MKRLIFIRPVFESPQGKKFVIVRNVQTGCGNHPASCSVSTDFFFLWVKRSGREFDR